MRAIRTGVLLICLGISSFAEALSQAQPKCFSYEPAVVKLSGILKRHTFTGLDYPTTHQTETYWVLVLQQPLCVNGGAYDDVPRKNIRMLQLVLDEKAYKSHRSLLGHRVIVTGKLFGEFTAQHHTPVLIVVDTLTASRYSTSRTP